MSKVWFKDVGFHRNPFSIKPAAFHDRVFGYDQVIDSISYGILNKKILVVQGEYGSGKSTILRRLINDFGGRKQVIYYSCNRMGQRLPVERLLKGKYGFWGKLFDWKAKDMILLLDEAQELGLRDYQKISSYFQEGYFKSIVLVGQAIDTKLIPKELVPKVEEIAVESISNDQAIHVIRKRVGRLKLLPDEIIIQIFDKSGRNVRKLLKNCEEACRIAVSLAKPVVDADILSKVFVDLKELEKEAPVVEKEPEPVKEEAKVEEKPKEKEPEEKASKEEKEAEPKEKKVEEVVAKAEKPAATKTTKAKKAKKVSVKASKKTKKKKKVYDPERYKDMMQASAEELLSKGTDEIFSDEKYP